MSADLAAARPYLWTYAPTLDVAQISAGEFICKNLAGRNAEYAEDFRYQISPRKFGIAVAQHKARTPSDAALVSALERCGASFGRYTVDGDDPQGPMGRGSDYKQPRSRAHASRWGDPRGVHLHAAGKASSRSQELGSRKCV
jgi:hypothetical protein